MVLKTRSVRVGAWSPHIVIPLLIGAAIVALVVASAWHALRPTTPVVVRPVLADRVVTQPVASQPTVSAVTVQAPGWLEADPYSIACTALADGVVEQIHVLEGEPIEEGQIVATLVKDDAVLALGRAQARHSSAEARLAVARANLVAAERVWETLVDRRRAVAVAQASIAETEASLAQLPVLIDEQAAIYQQLKEELELTRTARDQGAAANLEVIILEQRTGAQHAALEAMRLREAILQSQRTRQAADLAAAEQHMELRIEERQALDLAKASVLREEGDVQLAQVAVQEAELRLERMTIRSPITGYVQSRLKMPGDKVMLAADDRHSAHIVHAYDPSHMQVRVDVPLADAAHVSIGQACEVVVDVLPDDRFSGEVTRITHEADLQKNTLQVKVRITDPSPLMRPEMLARVRFVGGASSGASQSDAGAGAAQASTLVDARCVTPEGTVWVVRDRRAGTGRLEQVSVTVESTADGWATVRGDVRPGDLVALGSGYASGQRVRMERDDASTGGAS